VPPEATDVLAFWFGARARGLWFATDPAFDDDIRVRFGSLVDAVADEAFEPWILDGEGALAFTIVLDQFPRNLFRGSARAFAHDRRARQVAGRAIDAGFDRAAPLDRQLFFYLPFEHSESLADQERSLVLFTRWANAHQDAARAAADDELTYVRRHLETIRRFGRFPHRNAALGRTSTPDELEFLAKLA
jgi:uncharacterized protein (DUF924 family)